MQQLQHWLISLQIILGLWIHQPSSGNLWGSVICKAQPHELNWLSYWLAEACRNAFCGICLLMRIINHSVTSWNVIYVLLSHILAPKVYYLSIYSGGSPWQTGFLLKSYLKYTFLPCRLYLHSRVLKVVDACGCKNLAEVYLYSPNLRRMLFSNCAILRTLVSISNIVIILFHCLLSMPTEPTSLGKTWRLGFGLILQIMVTSWKGGSYIFERIFEGLGF